MTSESQIENHIKKNAQAIEELSIRIETLNRDVDTLLKELNVSPTQLTTFLSNSNNFTEDNWNALTAERKALDEKLLRELLNVSNPVKTKKTYAERHVQPHWLYVR